ncbi:NAD-specific glutamate dehydrogenase [compost metagenome]
MHLDQWQRVLQHRDVKGTAAQVEDQCAFELLLVQAVRHGRSGWLIDQALHLQTGKLGGKAGALALLVAEIRRHGNHRFVHRTAQERFGIGFQGTEHQGREFFGAERLIA